MSIFSAGGGAARDAPSVLAVGAVACDDGSDVQFLTGAALVTHLRDA
jgi:hypothetical protein